VSRIAVWTLFIAVLLIVVPVSFGAGEKYECQAEQRFRSLNGTRNDASAVSFDPCTMVDSGMLPWMRWSFDGGILMLCVSAWASWRSRVRGIRT
jgi:hypothetical protein